MNIDENKITIMGYRITINDMIDNLYYRTDIAWSKNIIGLKLLYTIKAGQIQMSSLKKLIFSTITYKT